MQGEDRVSARHIATTPLLLVSCILDRAVDGESWICCGVVNCPPSQVRSMPQQYGAAAVQLADARHASCRRLQDGSTHAAATATASPPNSRPLSDAPTGTRLPSEGARRPPFSARRRTKARRCTQLRPRPPTPCQRLDTHMRRAPSPAPTARPSKPSPSALPRRRGTRARLLLLPLPTRPPAPPLRPSTRATTAAPSRTRPPLDGVVRLLQLSQLQLQLQLQHSRPALPS